MNREKAIKFLMNLGWNKDGAEAIVDTALEDRVELTEEKLNKLHEDYMDR